MTMPTCGACGPPSFTPNSKNTTLLLVTLGDCVSLMLRREHYCHHCNVYCASVEHHEVEPTGCMDNEREPFMASREKPFPGDRPISAGAYPELRNLKATRSGVISVSVSYLGIAPASPDVRPFHPGCVTHAYLPLSPSLPPPNPQML